jgi:purine-binding chemotaxis protein CheW
VALTETQPPRAGRYVTFQLSRQYFAIRSDRIRHIVPASDVRVQSDGPPFLYGSVAVNGRLIPVIDLRGQLGLAARCLRPNATALIIALEPTCPVAMAGIIVDKLSEIVEFRAIEIRGATAQLRVQGRPYGRPKTLLDPEQLLDPEEWTRLKTAIF